MEEWQQNMLSDINKLRFILKSIILIWYATTIFQFSIWDTHHCIILSYHSERLNMYGIMTTEYVEWYQQAAIEVKINPYKWINDNFLTNFIIKKLIIEFK